MKRYALTACVLCGFCALTFAGPEPLPSGKEMKEVVPPMPPPCPDWTGFYIGGFGGYKFANGDIDLDLGGDWNTYPGSDEKAALEPVASRNLDFGGGEAGGLIGFNYQVHHWVFGAEATGAGLWLSDSHHAVAGVINDYDVDTSVETNYLVTVGPRVGYALCRWLPYVTGGVAIGNIDFDQGLFIVGNPDFGQGGSKTETEVGWMVGCGLEYAITNHWRVRGQYQYVDLGCVDFDSMFSPTSQGFTFPGNHEACLTEHNASFAVIFQF